MISITVRTCTERVEREIVSQWATSPLQRVWNEKEQHGLQRIISERLPDVLDQVISPVGKHQGCTWFMPKKHSFLILNIRISAQFISVVCTTQLAAALGCTPSYGMRKRGPAVPELIIKLP